ncbi:MAG TPA: YcjX family protein [Azospirillum sp.]|nr:YcjX family protein [Azospirillum sp.]
MRLPLFDDLTDAGSRLIERAGDVAGRALEPSVRLGVTGLRRAGKTVFTTAVVDNLLKPDRLPFLDVVSSGRMQAARLQPQPDPDVPRFQYEEHRRTLTGPTADWPEPTTGISQLRLAVRYRPAGTLKRVVRSMATLNLDIVDYPGEWLLDLPLLRQSFAEWSGLTLDLAERAPRAALSAEWRGWLGTVNPAEPAEEELARQGARLYTAYLHVCRTTDGLSLIQPGRFVEPGDLKNAPLLTFCPLPGAPRGRGTLWELMEDRYEAYKSVVVRRFFAEHFARLDRQIVLLDVLGALNAGPDAVADMKRSLEMSLEPFRHGTSGWFDWLFGTKIDRVLFAATKADHIASSQHPALRRLLDDLVGDARRSIRFEGAGVETMALAAVKCTDTVAAEHEGQQLRCVRGIPIGRDKPTVLYPGDIPDVQAVFERPYKFLKFRPPPGIGADGRALPHVRLDQALQFLLGDYLA